MTHVSGAICPNHPAHSMLGTGSGADARPLSNQVRVSGPACLFPPHGLLWTSVSACYMVFIWFLQQEWKGETSVHTTPCFFPSQIQFLQTQSRIWPPVLKSGDNSACPSHSIWKQRESPKLEVEIGLPPLPSFKLSSCGARHGGKYLNFFVPCLTHHPLPPKLWVGIINTCSIHFCKIKMERCQCNGSLRVVKRKCLVWDGDFRGQVF